MSQDAINRASRKAQRARRLPKDAACQQCGWTEIDALCRFGEEILCYECLLVRRGKAPTEAHHPLGRAIDPSTIKLPGNLHRALSDIQLDWLKEIRRNPNRDPLIWLAAACLGMRDHLAWWVAQLDRLAHFFVALSQWIRAQAGEDEEMLASVPTLFGLRFR